VEDLHVQAADTLPDPMSSERLASIIVNNHNYARWLGEAIDSALSQTHPRVEVVVVDDGSTDGSRELIESYGGRVVAVFQANAGQAAALNSGFVASHGDPVLFLDADDVLLDGAVEQAARVLADSGTAHAHWYQLLIDERSRPLGERYPEAELPEGDLRERAAAFGPDSVVTSATSGNAFPRWLLERVMPIPADIGYCAELYPISLARLFGRVALVEPPQSLYRRHPSSGYFTAPFEQQLQIGCEVSERLFEAYRRFSEEAGITAEVACWRKHSWYHRLRHVVAQLEQRVAPRVPILLIDGGQTGITPTPTLAVVPFPSRDGVWWGPPADDEEAIAELERQLRAGIRHLAVAWTGAWYLEHYPRFAEYLRRHSRLLSSDDLVSVFDLRPATRA
jgi:hypothetical protein